MNESSKRRKKKPSGFVLGRAAMEKISAVEGIVYPDEMKREFEDFDRKRLSGDERREAILKKYGIKR
jgi:hypothetical protein